MLESGAMFTGIIESTAKIVKITDAGIVLARPSMFQDLKIGCSIAVSGVCLSVTAFDDLSMSFDIVPTTFQKTKLGSLSAGDTVNLERAMKADGRFEGHIVTGHSEGTGVVVAVSANRFPVSAPTSHSFSSTTLSAVQAPTPDPSPWPSIAYANVGQQGEGSSALTQFDRLQKRVWNGTSESKFPPHVIVEHAREMRSAPTDAEKKLWDALKENKIDNIRFRRQHPIGSYILDFYADALKLAIEVDGETHQDPELKEYELHRTENLNSRGISVMRFSNDDILHRLKDVLSAIYSYGRAPLTQLSAAADLGEGSGVGANVASKPNNEEGVGGGDTMRGERGTLEEGSGVGANAAGKSIIKEPQTSELPNSLLTLRIPSDLLPYIVPHGSITLDGVALTVASVQGSDLTVALIPHTVSITTLGLLQTGDTVNLETDILGKYILKAHGHR